MKRKPALFIKLAGAIILTRAVSALALLPTGAGTGGDVIDQFLEATRAALTQSVRGIAAGKDLDQLCQCSPSSASQFACPYLQSLSPAQRSLCVDFVRKTADQMLALNTGSNRTGFLITYDPLFVPGPDGQDRPVIAATNADAQGEIIFHYDSIRVLSPVAMLFVVGHEFGHKVKYQGAFHGDNPPFGAFSALGGGRALMDSVGAALARYAVEHKTVGQSFGLEDSFDCRIRVNDMAFDSQGSSPRLFYAQDLDLYETGVGRYPQDFSCRFIEKDGVSSLFFRVLFHEGAGCNPNYPASRWTKVELWRLYDKRAGQPEPDPQMLDSRSIQGWNPLCQPLPAEPVRLDFSASDRHYSFEVTYLSSSARSQRRRKQGSPPE